MLDVLDGGADDLADMCADDTGNPLVQVLA